MVVEKDIIIQNNIRCLLQSREISDHRKAAKKKRETVNVHSVMRRLDIRVVCHHNVHFYSDMMIQKVKP